MTRLVQRALLIASALLLLNTPWTLANETVLLDKIIAIVDDDIVMQSELQHRIRTISQRLRAQGTPLPPQSVLESRVLDQLILESVQLQLAKRAGIRISDNQLNQTIRNIARSNQMTLEQFEAQLELEGETYASAREQIRREMIIGRIQQREVDRRVRVTEQEIETFLESKEGRTQSGMEYYIGHILIAVPEGASKQDEKAARQRAEGILSELRAGADFQQMAVARSDGRQALNGGVIGWRKENELPSIAADIIPSLAIREPSNLLRTGSGFHIITVLDKRGGQEKIVDQARTRHILISPNAIRSDEEAEALAQKLYQRIIQGDDFASLAKANSDDPVSAIDGGDLGWVSPGQMVPEFEAVVAQTPTGEISEPFRSKFGWHIVQVQERRQEDIGAMIQTNQARQVIHRRKYEEELANWLQEIRSEAFVSIKDERFKALEENPS
ncbi:MAG: peptidylprolyl isomerase [Oleiphilaceae bacterium]|nr:peptidylprolyl isomerase [Oleiphilaceae bacterium]